MSDDLLHRDSDLSNDPGPPGDPQSVPPGADSAGGQCDCAHAHSASEHGRRISRRDFFRNVTALAVGSSASLGAVDRVVNHYLPASGFTAAAAQADGSLHFGQRIVTPEGTPLGGSVDVDVWPDGNYYVKFHMHSSSVFGDFDYALRAYLTAPGFPTLVFVHSGNVSGVSDSDHEERGFNALIPLYWDQLVAGAKYTVAKEYDWVGIAGTILDVPGFILDILGFGVDFIAGSLGAIIGATVEAASLLNIDLGPGGTLGVLGGVAVMAVGLGLGLPVGAALITGTVAGVGIGAVAAEMIQSRPLNDAEIALGRKVYGDTINYGNVVLTNMSGMSNRPFTVPGVDGKTYINLGWRYPDPLGSLENSYPQRGQLLIHELAHALQIERRNFVPGYFCSAMIEQAHNSFGDSSYKYEGWTTPWSDLKLEQQASIIDDWYAATNWNTGYRPMDQASPFYHYIWEDVLHRNIPYGAPGNLRSASGMAIPQNPGKYDVYWTTPDGRVEGTWWDEGAPWNAPINVARAGLSANTGIALTTRIDTLEIYWPSPDGAVWHQWWTGLGWGEPHPITDPGWVALTSSNGFAQTISATSRSFPNMDMFWMSPDGAVCGQAWHDPGNVWESPFVLAPAGSAAGAVTAIARAPGAIHVFWVAPDGAVMTSVWEAPANAYSPAFSLAPPGSAIPTSLGVCSKASGHIDVFYVTPNGEIGTAWWNFGGWNAPFLVAGPGSAVGGLSAIARNPEHVVCFYVTQAGEIANVWWEPSDMGWRPPFSITPPSSVALGSAIRALARTPTVCDVFWVGPDGSVKSNWFNAGTWRGEFTLAGAGSAAVPPTPGAEVVPETMEAIVEEVSVAEEAPVLDVDDVPLDSDGDGLTDDQETTMYGTD
ncbi:MAG: hypothetical protein M9953_10955, partial [Thermomicrobiales bacterium]|nr:hypothetical protein [Thermomicrobiales bacterium]